MGQRASRSCIASASPISAAKPMPQMPLSVPMTSAGPKGLSNQPQQIVSPAPPVA